MSKHNDPQPIHTTPSHTNRPAPLSRLNLILAAFFLVQLALITFVYWPKSSAAASGPLLAGITEGGITALSISDNNNNAIRLERSGNGWVLAETDGFPANLDKVAQILTKLLNINTNRPVTATESSHSHLEVADNNFNTRIDLTTADGETTLFIGSSVGAGATHVRAAGQDATYLTNEIEAWEVNPLPSSWLNSRYVQLDAAPITAITLTNPNGTIEFTRGDDTKWTISALSEDEAANTGAIQTLVDQLTAINLTQPLGKSEQPEYGLAAPQATLLIATADEDGTQAEYTFLLGAKTSDESAYYFKSSDSPYYVTISAFTGDEFASKTRADFVTEPDAATEDISPNPSAITEPTANEEGPETETEATGDDPGASELFNESPLALPEESTPTPP